MDDFWVFVACVLGFTVLVGVLSGFGDGPDDDPDLMP